MPGGRRRENRELVMSAGRSKAFFRIGRRTFLLWSVSLAAGCGAMLNGPHQTVRVSSTPPGVRVSFDGRKEKTPVSLSLARDRSYKLEFEMAGFESREVVIESLPDPKVRILNCLLLCIPEIWEGGDATHFKLEPTVVDVSLDPIGWSPR
jgi:hypothetical protein